MRNMARKTLILLLISKYVTCSEDASIGRSFISSGGIDSIPRSGMVDKIPDHGASFDGSKRHRRNVISCYTSAQCSTLFPKSICQGNVCTCAPGLTFDSARRICASTETQLKRSLDGHGSTFLTSPGKPCDGTGPCGGGSFCDENTGMCTCPRWHSIYNGACVLQRGEGTELIDVQVTTPRRSRTKIAQQNGKARISAQNFTSRQFETKNRKIVAANTDRKTNDPAGRKFINAGEDVQQTRQENPPLRRRTPNFLCPMNVEPLFKTDDDQKAYILCNASRPSACPPLSYCFATGRALESGPYYCCPTN